MNAGLKRKEVWLSDNVIKNLQNLAARKKWSLKQYMEAVLTNASKKAISK